jgi:hypothetical protein
MNEGVQEFHPNGGAPPLHPAQKPRKIAIVQIEVNQELEIKVLMVGARVNTLTLLSRN